MRVKSMAIRPLAFGLMLIAGSAVGGPSEGKMMAYWEAQIQQQPDNPVHYLRRANGHAELGEWDEAFSDIERVEQLGEPLSAALARGDYYQRLGQHERALEQFNKVLSANPKQVRALILRARLQVERGEAMLALRDYQQLFRVYPDADTGHYRQAANLCVQQGQPGKALALLDERMRSVGPIPQLQSLAIDIDKQLGYFDSAIERMQSMHQRSKTTPYWHVELAELQRKAGHNDKAQRHLNIAEELLQARQQTGAARELEQRISAMRKVLADTEKS